MVSNTRSRAASAAVLSALALGACSSVELAAPIIRTRRGPAAEAEVRRVVALPATCGALSLHVVESHGNNLLAQRTACPSSALKAVDQVIRTNLELGGYSIIDAERVNAITASRHEVRERTLARTASTRPDLPTTETRREVTAIDVETIGARFEDATPLEQQALLGELGAKGLLSTRVTVGAEVGIGMRRTVMVQLQLLEMPERVLVWARRCELEIGGLFATDEIAMERAARCVSEGMNSR